jgi:hypothetical protein
MKSTDLKKATELITEIQYLDERIDIIDKDEGEIRAYMVSSRGSRELYQSCGLASEIQSILGVIIKAFLIRERSKKIIELKSIGVEYEEKA